MKFFIHKKALINNKGSSTMIMMTAFIMLFLTMLLFIYNYFCYSEAAIIAKTRGDAIADGAAVYGDTGVYDEDTIQAIIAGKSDISNAKTIINATNADRMARMLLIYNNRILKDSGFEMKINTNTKNPLTTTIGKNTNDIYSISGVLSTDFRYLITQSTINVPEVFNVIDDNAKIKTNNTVEILNKEGFFSNNYYCDTDEYYPDDYHRPCVPLIKSYITTFIEGNFSIKKQSKYIPDLYQSILNQFQLTSKRYQNAKKDGGESLAEKVLLWDILNAYGFTDIKVVDNEKVLNVKDIYEKIKSSIAKNENKWISISNVELAQEKANSGQLTVLFYKGHIYPVIPVYTLENTEKEILNVMKQGTSLINITDTSNWSEKLEILSLTDGYKKDGAYIFSFNSLSL